MTACLTIAICGMAFGCSDDEETKRIPDSGYGAALPVPATINCSDLCARLGDCSVHLCVEDTGSTAYEGLDDMVTAQCEASCAEATLKSQMTTEQWSCLFVSSCREVFGYDDCHAGGSYYCK